MDTNYDIQYRKHEDYIKVKDKSILVITRKEILLYRAKD